MKIILYFQNLTKLYNSVVLNLDKAKIYFKNFFLLTLPSAIICTDILPTDFMVFQNRKQKTYSEIIAEKIKNLLLIDKMITILWVFYISL